MKALIQRVSSASVEVDQKIIGRIEQGLLVFLGVEKKDTTDSAAKMAHKLLNYRIFADELGKMNLSASDVDGGLLVVSQFTLLASTEKGMRPSFSNAGDPVLAQKYYQALVDTLRHSHSNVATGEFGADMRVSLVNDGPVTFLLEI